jgi:hypothetical protein
LDSNGIDIILGMDWLRKYDGVILCAKRAIRLTKEDGTLVEFNAVIPTEQVSLLNKVQGVSLNEIGIVREYPDVFPEELPGMPSDRDIEFMIELLPGNMKQNSKQIIPTYSQALPESQGEILLRGVGL